MGSGVLHSLFDFELAFLDQLLPLEIGQHRLVEGRVHNFLLVQDLNIEQMLVEVDAEVGVTADNYSLPGLQVAVLAVILILGRRVTLLELELLAVGHFGGLLSYLIITCIFELGAI